MVPSNPAVPIEVPKTPAEAKMVAILTKMIGDMRFVGIAFIITGIMSCLSIVGAIVGIPTILCGTRLRESADSLSLYRNSRDTNALFTALEKQGSFFFMQKVLLIIGICSTVLVFFIYLIVIVAVTTSGI
jgi:hypothetical protein